MRNSCFSAAGQALSGTLSSINSGCRMAIPMFIYRVADGVCRLKSVTYCTGGSRQGASENKGLEFVWTPRHARIFYHSRVLVHTYVNPCFRVPLMSTVLATGAIDESISQLMLLFFSLDDWVNKKRPFSFSSSSSSSSSSSPVLLQVTTARVP